MIYVLRVCEAVYSLLVHTIFQIWSRIIHSLHPVNILQSVLLHTLHIRTWWRRRRNHVQSVHGHVVIRRKRTWSHVTWHVTSHVISTCLIKSHCLVFNWLVWTVELLGVAVRFQYGSVIVGESHGKQGLGITHEFVNVSLSCHFLHYSFLIVISKRSTKFVVIHSRSILL